MRMKMRANDREYTYDTMIFMNEMLVVGMALLDFTAIALVSRFGREWLYGLIGVNLILISTTGAKLIEHFGLITNVGNVFYAAVFLCLFLLIEQYGHRSAIRGIWLGFALLAFFIGMTQFVLSTVATSDTRAFDLALHGTFTPHHASCSQVSSHISSRPTRHSGYSPECESAYPMPMYGCVRCLLSCVVNFLTASCSSLSPLDFHYLSRS